MATELAAIDLGTLPAPAARVLVIDRDDVSSAGGLITVWAGHGIEFTSLDVPGYARAQLDDPERGDVARDVNAEIADWCDTFDAAPGTGSGGLPAAGTGGGSLDVGMSTDGSLAPGAGTPSEAPTAIREHVSITGDPCGRTVEESVVRLGVNGDLLGIVTHPATDTEVARGTLSGSRYVARTLNVPRAPERTASALATTAVLILTTGSNVRSGPGRLATTLARRWASRGLTVVRYDRRGVGGSGVDVDSGNGRGWMVGDAYGELNIEDAADVLRWMRAQGHERVVLVGMCSGAWLGYRTLAHELPPDASMPVGLVAINQVMWDDINWGGDGESPALAAKAGRELKKGIASPDRWKDLARGEIPVWTNIARLFRLATMLVRQRFCSEVNALSEQLGVIEKRGVWQIQVFDAEELGPAYLQMRGESAIERLCNAGLLTRLDTAGAGHTFAPGASKKWLMERLDAELQRRGVFADVSHGS